MNRRDAVLLKAEKTSTVSVEISTHRNYYIDPRTQSIAGLEDEVLRLPSFRRNRGAHLTRVFLGLEERGRGLIAIDEPVIFFDPSITALSYGEEAAAATAAAAASTVAVESPFFPFSSFHLEPARIAECSSFRARRRPRDPMPRGHAVAFSILCPLRSLPRFLLARVLSSYLPTTLFYLVSPSPCILKSGMRVLGKHVRSECRYLVICTGICLSPVTRSFEYFLRIDCPRTL